MYQGRFPKEKKAFYENLQVLQERLLKGDIVIVSDLNVTVGSYKTALGHVIE